MELDVNKIISNLKKYTSESTSEFNEQESTDAGSSAPSSSVPKWADVLGGPKRSKANMLGKKGEKWNTGLNRGVANQIW